jgi:low temperature requirement protein LtrA
VSSLLVDSEHRVSTVELFFDLVFVFAFTQVTTLWLEQATWGGLGRGLLVICALWWAWASYAWLTNAADVEADSVHGVMLFATGALFVAALAVPEAFGARRFVFAVALFMVLAGFVGLYALVGKREPDLLAAVLRISWPVVSGAALIVAAAFTPAGWRPAVWSLALVIGFFGPLLTGLEGWRVYPAHFAERHGLIVIIAIGESLGAIGFGARGTPLDARVIVAAVLGFLAAASFWLGYFDYASGGVRDVLAKRRGTERIAFARDAYTYAHLPMVVGIILFAFGVRTTMRPRRCGATADSGARTVLRPRALPARVRRTPLAGHAYARTRPPERRRRVRAPHRRRNARAGPRRARARHGRLGRAARIRVDRMARGTRTPAGGAHS